MKSTEEKVVELRNMAFASCPDFRTATMKLWAKLVDRYGPRLSLPDRVQIDPKWIPYGSALAPPKPKRARMEWKSKSKGQEVLLITFEYSERFNVYFDSDTEKLWWEGQFPAVERIKPFLDSEE